MGSFKLWVNRSRFGRSDPKDTQTKDTPVNNNHSQTVATNLESRENGVSFRNALLRGGASRESVVLKVPINESWCKELQNSVVGVLACENEMHRIQTTLFMEGFQSIKVTSMGGEHGSFKKLSGRRYPEIANRVERSWAFLLVTQMKSACLKKQRLRDTLHYPNLKTFHHRLEQIFLRT
jgi:hypothetical protein